MTGFVVVNPRSAGGHTAREWPAIERALRTAYPHMTLAITHARGEATELVREALTDGHPSRAHVKIQVLLFQEFCN